MTKSPCCLEREQVNLKRRNTIQWERHQGWSCKKRLLAVSSVLTSCISRAGGNRSWRGQLCPRSQGEGCSTQTSCALAGQTALGLWQLNIFNKAVTLLSRNKELWVSFKSVAQPQERETALHSAFLPWAFQPLRTRYRVHRQILSIDGDLYISFLETESITHRSRSLLREKKEGALVTTFRTLSSRRDKTTKE